MPWCIEHMTRPCLSDGSQDASHLLPGLTIPRVIIFCPCVIIFCQCVIIFCPCVIFLCPCVIIFCPCVIIFCPYVIIFCLCVINFYCYCIPQLLLYYCYCKPQLLLCHKKTHSVLWELTTICGSLRMNTHKNTKPIK